MYVYMAHVCFYVCCSDCVAVHMIICIGHVLITIEGKMSASRTLAAGYSSEMGLYEVPCDESLPGLGIGMGNEVFKIYVVE